MSDIGKAIMKGKRKRHMRREQASENKKTTTKTRQEQIGDEKQTVTIYGGQDDDERKRCIERSVKKGLLRGKSKAGASKNSRLTHQKTGDIT